MAACLDEDFEKWLSLKLKALNTDESVFGSYITGILDGEESLDEKTEALEGILTEITENDIKQHCHEILDRWKLSQVGSASGGLPESVESKEDVDVKLVRLLESTAQPTTVQKQYTEEERKIREAILAQYSQTSDNEEEEPDEVVPESSDGGLVKNTNVSSVVQAEKEKREKAKVESQKKKEKDREDR
ncbi:hypothetical protein AAG570_001762 [Ranatra chinensis]|uniref:Coiled-coil domain-containing protein 43 n=1 Tax=Ranatra chinensis TaxID=642074 RepID=A0ABD0Y9R4_9HEMI